MKRQQKKEFDFLTFVKDEKTRFYGLDPRRIREDAINIAESLSRRIGRTAANGEILVIMESSFYEVGKNSQKFKVAFFKKLYAKIGTKTPKGYDSVGSCEGWDLLESLFFNLETQGYISCEPKYEDYSYEDREDPLRDDDENAQFD